jgi:hypothetical protein
MRTLHRLAAALVLCFSLTACAIYTTAGRVTAPHGRTQDLPIRTDPAGASCSLLQRGTIVASVDPTPGIAVVPRADAPLDVVCRKEGYLEIRASVAVLYLHDHLDAIEARPKGAPKYERTAGDWATELAVNVTGGVFPPAGIAWAWSLVKEYEEQNPPFAYRALPEFMLTPAAFDSEASRDEFFLTLKGRLEAAANAQLARIDKECRYWPCTPADAACPDPVCEHLRAVVTSQLQSQLEQIPLLRAQVRVVVR